MNKNDKYNNDNIKLLNYKIKYFELIEDVKDAVNEINASDYSRKSFGRFKEKIERILYDNL